MTEKRSSNYKYCFVPACTSTSVTCPNKIFFSVPRHDKQRKKWLALSRRDLHKSPLSPRTLLFCCEDHFDLENDMANYRQYIIYRELGNRTVALLKPGVVPHKFDCQTVRQITLPKPRHTVLVKLQHQEIVRDSLSSSVFSVPNEDAEVVNEEICDEPQEVGPAAETVSTNDKATQTSRIWCRPLMKSVRVQTNKPHAEKRPLVDVETQSSPKKLCLSPVQSPPQSSSSSSRVSTGGSEFVVTSSGSSSGESMTEKKKRLKKFMSEATLEIIENSTKFYLGVTPESYEFIKKIAGLCHISKRDMLLILKKLRLNQPFTALGDDFGISQSQASRIFHTSIVTLATEMKALIYLPQRTSIAYNMPIAFRRRYSKVISIIDCFEIKIEKPANPCNQALTWSEYKKANTVKYLVSITPHGFVSYVSGGYCGRTTDTNLTKECGYLDLLSEGDNILADRGFKGLEPLLRAKGVTLIRPPSVASGVQLPKPLVRESKRIASLRIHVERLIGRLRFFNFISPNTHVDVKLIPLLNAAVWVICALCNLQGPLIL